MYARARPQRSLGASAAARPWVTGFVDKVFVTLVACYLAAAAGLTANLLTPVEDTGEALEGSGILSISWLVFYALSAPFIVSSLRTSITAREVVIFLYAALVLAGYTWSVMPGSTLIYSASLVANILFAWTCWRKLPLERFERILLGVLNAMIVVGLLMAVAGLPHAYYYDPTDRSNVLGTALVRGLFSHKIYAGFYASMAYAMNLTLLRTKMRFVLAAICVVAVLVSGSSLGLVALLLVNAMMFCLPRLKDKQLQIVVLFAMFFATTTLLMSWDLLFAEAVGALDRDVTLTGRTTLWQYAIQFWSEKPVLGWAYGGIFGDDPNAPGRTIMVGSTYQAPHFHDVYLQVAAETGTVGLLLFATIVVATLVGGLRNTWLLRRPEDLIVAIFTLSLAVIGVVMNVGSRYNELSTILLFFFFLSTSSAIRRAPSRSRGVQAKPRLPNVIRPFAAKP